MSKEEEYAGLDDDDIFPPPISLADLKQRIVEKHGIVIGDDDPIMIQHTMHGFFIEDLQVNLKATSKLTSASVAECLNVLKNETLDSSLKQTLERLHVDAQAMAGAKAALKKLRNITLLFVTLSWVALFLNILVFIRS